MLLNLISTWEQVNPHINAVGSSNRTPCWFSKVKTLSPLYLQKQNKKNTNGTNNLEVCALSQHLHGEQVFLCELQVIVITKPPQHSPGGLVSTSLYEEGVQEQEACNNHPMTAERSAIVIKEWTKIRIVEGTWGRISNEEEGGKRMKQVKTGETDLWVWVRCPWLHRSCSSWPRSLHPLRPEAPVVYWNTFSIDIHSKRHIDECHEKVAAFFQVLFMFKPATLNQSNSLMRPGTSKVPQVVLVMKTCTTPMKPPELCWQWHYLEEVELIVIKDAVVVQVRHFKDSS